MKKTRSELDKLGFEFKSTNSHAPNSTLRLVASKGDIIYLQCNGCGSEIFKPITSFGLQTKGFMMKAGNCRSCMNEKNGVYKKRMVGTISTKEANSIIYNTIMPAFKVVAGVGGFSIMYTIGNSFEWKKANNNIYDYVYQARSSINKDLMDKILRENDLDFDSILTERKV